MMKKLLTFLSCLFLSVGAVVAQDITATGTVVDEAGMEVIGATVVRKGTSTGVATNVDGKFSIKVPEGSTLVFSMVGMATIEKKAATDMKVVMETKTSTLDEVMVVAYGTATKASFTGSASVVKADAIGDMQTTNPVNALKGRVTGVQIANESGQPGQSSPTIRIRGISSINAGNAPLIVLDGSPFDGDMNAINNNDIESMTVLKDAASSALYGARGANGVIIITTKKGKDGVARINFEAQWGVNSKGTQNYDVVRSPAQYYEMYYGALKSYMQNKQGYTAERAHVFANNNMVASGSDYSLGYNVYNVPNGQYLIGANGKMNPNATLGNSVSYQGKEYLLTPDDWIDNAYKNSLRQEYSLSVSAGNDKSTFYSSLNYLNIEGITKNSNFERISGRLKADYQANSWFKMGANMDYVHYNTKAMSDDGSSASSGNIFAISTQIAPIYPLFVRDGNGNIMTDGNGITMYDYGDSMNAGRNRPIFTGSNAISASLLDKNKDAGNAVNSIFFGEIRFLEDFKLTSTNNVYANEVLSTLVTNPYYGQYASAKGIVSKYSTRRYAFNLQQLLTYAKKIGGHNLDIMAGHEYTKDRYYYLFGSKSNMFDPSNPELNGAILDRSAASYSTNYNVEGYFSRVQYDFEEKYFVSGSFRRDGSSRFHPDHRWGNFTSFGGAWIASKEDNFDISWIDFLKLKASYGEQGNDQIGNYLYTNTYKIVNSSGNPAAVPDVMGNEKISWEKQGNFNAGVEFDLFNNVLSGGIEYFYRKRSNMLAWFTLPVSLGYTGYWDNVGDMRNEGFEIELNVNPINTKDLKWDIRVNLTKVSNKITFIPDENKTMEIDGVKGYSSGDKFLGEGLPMFTYRMKKYAGVNEAGESLFYKNGKDAEGKTILETTTTYADGSYYLCGTALPDVYGGFGTSASYKGFDFSIDFAYQLGGKVYDGDYAGFMGSPYSGSRGSGFHADLLDSWSSDNKGSNIPRFQYGDTQANSSSDRFLTSASYLSLQNINAGYTFPSRLCKGVGIEKLRVYVSADNVWLWAKRQGLDPRQSIDGSSTSSFYAPIRTISGGVSLTF